MSIFLKILVPLLFSFGSLFAAEVPPPDSISSFDEFISRMNFAKTDINYNLIEFKTGYYGVTFNKSALRQNFAPAYLMEIKYGFFRIDTAYSRSRLVKTASEYTFIGNMSSHMKPRNWVSPGLTTDNWRFGFGFTNGWGWRIGNKSRLILTHAGDLVWSHIDIEQSLSERERQKYLDDFDDIYKFGNSYSSGISLIMGGVSISTRYEHLAVYPSVVGGKWLASSSLELVLQRSIDYFSQELINRNTLFAPVLIYTAKTLLSTAIYEMKRNKSFFPFSSTAPINYDGVQISIKYLF